MLWPALNATGSAPRARAGWRASAELSLPAAFALAAFGIRLVRIGSRGFWFDEAFSAWLANQSAREIVRYPDYHPPLYYLFLHVWAQLGGWAASDAGMRLPSAVASALSVGVGVWLLLHLRVPGALLAGILGSTSAVSVWYGQEARMYALTGLAAMVAVAALCLQGAAVLGRRQLALGPSLLCWAVYALAGALGMYLDYDAIPVLLAGTAVYVALAIYCRAKLAPWAAATSMLLILYVPDLPALRGTLARADTVHLAKQGPDLLAGFLVGCLMIVAAAAVAWRKPELRGKLLVAGVLGCLLGLDAAGLTVYGISLKRHLVVILPEAIPAASVVLAGVWPDRRRQLLLAAAGIPALLSVLFLQQKEDWKAAAAILRAFAAPGDVVVMYESLPATLERYYRPVHPILWLGHTTTLASLRTGELSTQRVWVVDSDTADPATLARLGHSRPWIRQWSLYRVRVQEFGSLTATTESSRGG